MELIGGHPVPSRIDRTTGRRAQIRTTQHAIIVVWQTDQMPTPAYERFSLHSSDTAEAWAARIRDDDDR